jgi:hypothetical protein
MATEERGQREFLSCSECIITRGDVLVLFDVDSFCGGFFCVTGGIEHYPRSNRNDEYVLD